MSPVALAVASAGETRAGPGWPGQRPQEQEVRPQLPRARRGPHGCAEAEPPVPWGLGHRAGQESQKPRGPAGFAAPCRLSGLAQHHLSPKHSGLLAPAAPARLSAVPTLS